MNLRFLGICALVGAPFLLITFLALSDNLDQKSAEDGVYSLLYITGWMCSIIGLRQIEATGTNRWGRIVLVMQLFFLSLANLSNLMLLFQISLDSTLYFILDLFWPVSNIWMLATGITVITAKRLHGWARFVPLAVGLWLPFSVLLLVTLGKTEVSLWASGVYSAITWVLLGLVVFRSGAQPTFSKPHIA